MHLRKEPEPSGLEWLHPGDFQNNCGEAGDLGILRLRHFLQVSHVSFRNVRLLHKRKYFGCVLNDPSLAFRQCAAALADMYSVAFTRELLVRPFSPADSAVVTHPELPQATQNQNNES